MTSKTNLKETIQRIIEIPLDELRDQEQYDMNIDRYGDHSDTCLICGKRTNGNSKFVHLLTNGNIVSYGGEDISDSQGFFPVGNNCAKRLIIQFTFK